MDEGEIKVMKVSACSYEGSLFGWNVTIKSNSTSNIDNGFSASIVPTPPVLIDLEYGFHCSINSLKTIAISPSGTNLVVSGVEEKVRIYHIGGQKTTNRELGEISNTHTGSITKLEFVGDEFLLTASEDSTLCIWRCKDWHCLHILGGHKAGVNDFSVHPSGKMALSVSKDHTMKVWNLVQGRCAFTRRLRKPADFVAWNKTGDFYSLVANNELQVFATSDNSCQSTIAKKSRINKAIFCNLNHDSEADPQKYGRVVCICEDKTLTLSEFNGNMTVSVNLSTIVSGRLRDISACRPNVSSVVVDDYLAIVTSTGQLLILSCQLLEQLSIVKQIESIIIEKSLICMDQLKAEPRLTAVATWSCYTQDNQRWKQSHEQEILQNKEDVEKTDTSFKRKKIDDKISDLKQKDVKIDENKIEKKNVPKAIDKSKKLNVKINKKNRKPNNLS